MDSTPDVLAREIVEDLTAALVEFEAVAAALEEQLAGPSASAVESGDQPIAESNEPPLPTARG